MKKKFSKYWKSSKQPRKQRKYLTNAPLNLRMKFLKANLSKELRKKYGLKTSTIRKGDIVKIMRGKLKKKEGKVLRVDYKRLKVEIEGIQIKKQDGSKVNIKINPSNLQITELNLDDKKRLRKYKKNVKEEKNASQKRSNA